MKTIKVVLSRVINTDRFTALIALPKEKLSPTITSKRLISISDHAWGLCYAFDSLYVVVNDKKYEGRGLYRVQDTNQDDKFDKVTLLKKFQEVWAENMAHTQLSYRLTESPFI